MKFEKDYIVYIFFIVIICIMSFKLYSLEKETRRQVQEIEYYNEGDGMYTKLYYDQTIESLKEENRKLYDSLKAHKNEIDYLVQFKYENEYKVNKVEKKADVITKDTLQKDTTINVYEYVDNDKDSLDYILKIASEIEPKWYSLDISVSDEFTIVNKKINELNQINIQTTNEGLINDVTVLRKKEKKNFFDNVSVGPSITCGYDFADKDVDLFIGFSITYDIKEWLKK